uniref:Uncharacterized protein n=1 Tax=Oryza glumipatula TaxID=40148 RepID=A0A0D9Z8X5_9ORYZ
MSTESLPRPLQNLPFTKPYSYSSSSSSVSKYCSSVSDSEDVSSSESEFVCKGFFPFPSETKEAISNPSAVASRIRKERDLRRRFDSCCLLLSGLWPEAGAYSDPFSVRPEAESSRQLRRLLRLSARRLHRWSIDGGSCGRWGMEHDALRQAVLGLMFSSVVAAQGSPKAETTAGTAAAPPVAAIATSPAIGWVVGATREGEDPMFLELAVAAAFHAEKSANASTLEAGASVPIGPAAPLGPVAPLGSVSPGPVAPLGPDGSATSPGLIASPGLGLLELVGEQMEGTATQPMQGVVEPFFAPLPPPLVATPPVRRRGRPRKKVLLPSRHSKRLEARPSPVPVSMRAQVRIMKEMRVLKPGEPVGDEALAEYIKRFQNPLPTVVVQGIRALTGLDSGKPLPPDVTETDGATPEWQRCRPMVDGQWSSEGAASSDATGRGLLLLIEITRTLMDLGTEETEAGGSSRWARRSIGVGGPLPIQWHDDEQATACCCNPLARQPPLLLQCPPPPLHCRHA